MLLITRPLSIIFFLLSLTFSFEGHAAEAIAQVYSVFGKVTQLSPGDLIARRVVKGDKISVGTSIVTSKKSFVQIVYLSGGSVNVGPKSKVVLKQNLKKKLGVISLLKGRVRSSFKDPSVRKTNNLKFFVKTRTAAMGVRGTEFQTIYNPENDVTNLLTFNGEVSMVKLEDAEIKKKSKKRKKRKAKRRKRKKVRRKIKRNSIDDIEVDIEVVDDESDIDLDELISTSDEAVSVKMGQYSGVVPGLEKASLPVKISPLQLAALTRNSAINSKTNKKELKPYELDKVKIKAFAPQAGQKAPPEGMFDASTGDYAPKAGGFIDLETGIYIQPSAHARYDEKLKLYVENKQGTIDQDTGQYIPPSGLKLDPIKGFTPEGRKNKKKKSLRLASRSLNNSIQKNILLKSSKSTAKLAALNFLSEQELYSKNILTYRYLMGSQSLTTTNDTKLGDDSYESDSRSGYRLEWEIASNSTWRPYTFFESQSVNMTISNNAIHKASKDTMEIAAGVKYFKNDRISYYGQVGFDQNIMLLHPADASTGTVIESNYERVSRFKILGGLDYILMKKKQYSLHANTFLSVLPSSEQETLNLGTSLTYGLKLNFNYWIKRTIRLNAGFEIEKIYMNLAYPTIEYDQNISTSTPTLSITKVF